LLANISIPFVVNLLHYTSYLTIGSARRNNSMSPKSHGYAAFLLNLKLAINC